MTDNKHLTNHIEEIEWVDSMSTHGWEGELSKGIGKIRSIGYVVADEDDHVTLAESICLTKPSSAYGCQTSIPKRAITKRTILRNRK